MTGRSVSSWENFSWYNEGGGVGSEILEEVGQTVEEHESSNVGLESIVKETHER